MKQCKSVEILSMIGMSSNPVQTSRPYWCLSGDGSEQRYRAGEGSNKVERNTNL